MPHAPPKSKASGSKPPSPSSTSSTKQWNAKTIRALVKRRFNKRACWMQIKIALAIRAGKDVVGVAATGAGKTLSFWIALAIALEEGQDKMIIVVTPLNLLGKQNERVLSEAGISSIAVTKDNNNQETYKDIADGKYRAVTISPELLNEEPCSGMWDNIKFTSRLLYLVFDEGHCISQWGTTFRNQYLFVGNIRFLLPHTIPIYVASATLPPPILQDVREILRLRPDHTELIIRSNDRPNIHIIVREMQHAIHSYHDLAFLIPENFAVGDPPPPKFLVFHDSTTSAEDAVKYLQSRLPPEYKDKIRWFHSTMTPQYREKEFEKFRSGETWGMAVTDAFGMGLDLPDIDVVVQYRCPKDLCTLWQRFGRAGRGVGTQAVAILLVEKSYYDKERKKKVERARKRKAGKQLGRPPKRHCPDSRTNLSAATDDVGEHEHADVRVDFDENSFEVLETRDDEERRAAYHKRAHLVSSSKSLKQKGGRDIPLGGPMDDLINAPTRHINCRRRIPTLFFNNDKAPQNDHLFCDVETPGGCSRCKPQPVRFGCDLCHPNAFPQYDPVHVEKSSKGPSKSHVDDYEPGDRDKKLKEALVEWRRENASAKLSRVAFRQYGPHSFMSDDIVARLVDCAHIGKITTSASVAAETHWRDDRVAEFGDSLVALIAQFSPPPLPPPPDPVSSTPKTRAPPRCSACKELGHNSKNARCPAKLALLTSSRRGPVQDENIPPPLPPALSSIPVHISTPNQSAQHFTARGSPTAIPPGRFYAGELHNRRTPVQLRTLMPRVTPSSNQAFRFGAAPSSSSIPFPLFYSPSGSSVPYTPSTSHKNLTDLP